MHHERIAILDYGSQYTRLITRRLRELQPTLTATGVEVTFNRTNRGAMVTVRKVCSQSVTSVTDDPKA